MLRRDAIPIVSPRQETGRPLLTAPAWVRDTLRGAAGLPVPCAITLSPTMFSHNFDPQLVRALGTAESQFLQVLVDRFRIRRKGNGFELQVAFNEESPSIWLSAAKRHILSTLPAERRRSLQRQIEAFFASGAEAYDYHDPSFPFRLGNGGTLPVIRRGGTDYYCLFYRDSYPTGWNIANGGANTRSDLKHPDLIVEREMREELIIVEPERGWWHVFDWHDARLREHPDFARAQELWAEHFRRQGFREFATVPLPLKWSLPPDADRQAVEHRQHDAMRIRCGDEAAIYTGQGFLNVNAEDFGIEFDRIAKLSVGPEAIFCDGELHGDGLLNRVVGLFSVARMQKEIAAGQHHFLPDRIYWDGEDRTGDEPKAVIGDFLKGRRSSWPQLEDHIRRNAAPEPPGDPFDLCPVSRTIVRRHLQLQATEPPAPTPGEAFEVFISFASEDRALARRVFDHLSATTRRRVFFSDLTLTGGAFGEQIDRALDSVWSFVAVGSRLEHLNKSWVSYEWRNFHNDLTSGRKPPHSPFLAFVSGIDPRDLPRPLRVQPAVIADPADPAPALALLDRFIVKP